MRKNTLSIIIVNWNTSEVLEKCLGSLKKYSASIPTDVFVVDNASSDMSVSMVKHSFPGVTIIANNENIGFGKANNQVLRKIKTEFVYIMNPDIEVTKGSTDLLINYLQHHPRVAAVAPLMVNPDGSLQEKGYYSRFPSVLQILMFYTELSRLSVNVPFLVNRYLETKMRKDHPFAVDQLPGACIFARTEELQKVEFFDERYFLLFEDVDLSYKLHKAGYNLFVIPESRVIHLGGASLKKLDDADLQIKFFRGMFIFFTIHGTILDRIVVKFILLCNLLYLMALVEMKRIYKPTTEASLFLARKWKVTKWLLVS